MCEYLFVINYYNALIICIWMVSSPEAEFISTISKRCSIILLPSIYWLPSYSIFLMSNKANSISFTYLLSTQSLNTFNIFSWVSLSWRSSSAYLISNYFLEMAFFILSIDFNIKNKKYKYFYTVNESK